MDTLVRQSNMLSHIILFLLPTTTPKGVTDNGENNNNEIVISSKHGVSVVCPGVFRETEGHTFGPTLLYVERPTRVVVVRSGFGSILNPPGVF